MTQRTTPLEPLRPIPALLLLSLALGVAGCNCGGGDGESGTGEGAEAPVSEVFEDLDTQLDLIELVHLADVYHHGLYMDFGTAAQAKYSVGDWRSGWGARAAEGDATFSFVGTRARFYFPVDEAGDHTLRIRLRAHGTERLTPYLNGETVQSLTIRQGEFADYDVTLPGSKLVVGENNIQLVFGGSTQVGGEDVSAAIESVRVVRGSFPDGQFDAPAFDALVATVALGGTERQAVVTRRPMSLRYHVQVPANGRLGFGVGLEGEGDAPVKVFVTGDNGTRQEVFSGTAGGSWNDQVVDLNAFAGQVVRLELASESAGAGRVAWSVPRILVPHVERPTIEPARNVVVVLIDTLRADKLRPFNSNSRVEAPTIDSLAQAGAVFELAQSAENWTKPSVASVLTGLYPMTHGQKTESSSLSPDAVLLSEHLKEQGFRTGSFLANGYVSDRFGFNQGWDHYTNYIRENKSTEAENVFSEAATWIEQNRGERFFAYIQTIDPHVPYDPPEEYLRRYDARPNYAGQVRARMTPDLLVGAKRNPPTVTFDESDRRRLEALHDAEITQHDHFFGRFLARLEELGLTEDTLVVVVSDHGEEFNDHGSYGHGHSVYQELLHVPLMFRLPGRIPTNTRVGTAVSTLNIPATVTDLLGVPTMPTQEGRSLVNLMLGVNQPGPQVAFSDFQDERRVITTGRWKFLLRGNLTSTMFDLQQDPRERQQLPAGSSPVAQRFCRVMLSQFLGSTERGNWTGSQQRRGTELRGGDAVMDDEIQGQLRALGYAH
ncbi:MAG: sulfatase-like hydrolase/transferase [Sandaracinaceae bacterium]|nr:sulfatase-like hydrolase/transferase [Myxococcales bacterium]MCB9658541.1 sulfatase-like hydrolase/transferase [Sandaracinaceae bacterium]